MRKKIGIGILVFASIIFLASSIDNVTKFLSDMRKTPLAMECWWGSDKYHYGDLYGMSYLSNFKILNPTGSEEIVKNWSCATPNLVYNIYALSDSYTWNVFKDSSNMCNTNKSTYAASNFHEVLPVTIDSTKKNIVVIEMVERNVRHAFADSSYLSSFIQIAPHSNGQKNAGNTGEKKSARLNFKLKDADANYEFNIWDYRFLTPLKEFKADVQYKWFNRSNHDVAVSPDGHFLLLRTTVDPVFSESSFRPVYEKEIESLVYALNKAYDHYKQLGFSEVYVTMIPNPATILYPSYHGYSYNQLIPKIQSDPSLKLKVVDCYNLFKNYPNKEALYSRSDTHWTNVGKQVWLKEFNRILVNNSH